MSAMLARRERILKYPQQTQQVTNLNQTHERNKFTYFVFIYRASKLASLVKSRRGFLTPTIINNNEKWMFLQGEENEYSDKRYRNPNSQCNKNKMDQKKSASW